MTTINGNMDDSQDWIPLSTSNVKTLVRGYYVIDAENILLLDEEVLGSSKPKGRVVIRSIAGSSAGHHSSGATLTQYFPNSPSGNFSGNYLDLTGAPTLANVATSGDYNDLANIPQDVFYVWDFSINGGNTGTFAFGPTLPSATFVNAAFLQVITPFTSDGSATVAFTTGEGVGDIKTATAYNDVTYGSGVHRISVNKLTTTVRSPAIVIGGAVLTGGKVKIFLDATEGWG